jgi:hypothetical protein
MVAAACALDRARACRWECLERGHAAVTALMAGRYSTTASARVRQCHLLSPGAFSRETREHRVASTL